MNTKTLIFAGIMITAIILSFSVIAFMQMDDTNNNEVVIENSSDAGWRYTDISDKGFDCKTIMWNNYHALCVDWDGVRELK